MGQQHTITEEAPEEQTPTRTLDEEIAASVLATDEATEEAIAGLEPEGGEQVESESPVGTEDAGPAPVEDPVEPTPEPITQPSDELATARAEIERLGRESDLRRQETESQTLIAGSHQLAANYEQKLVSAGETAESAKALAESERGKYVAQEQLRMVETRATQQYKVGLAKELAIQSGMSFDALMTHSSEESMRAAATTAEPQAKEMATLKKEVAELKKARVPVQPYSNQATRTSATSEEQLQNQYIAGVRTPEAEAAGRRMAGGQ